MTYLILAPVAILLKLFQSLLGWLFIAPFIWGRLTEIYKLIYDHL